MTLRSSQITGQREQGGDGDKVELEKGQKGRIKFSISSTFYKQKCFVQKSFVQLLCAYSLGL